jgi:hypothetical protein
VSLDTLDNRFVANIDDSQHGTRTGYVYHKCRCKQCTNENSRYARRWRGRNRWRLDVYNERDRKKYAALKGNK